MGKDGESLKSMDYQQVLNMFWYLDSPTYDMLFKFMLAKEHAEEDVERLNLKVQELEGIILDQE